MAEKNRIDEFLERPGTQFSKSFGMAGYAKRAVLEFLKFFYSSPENTKDIYSADPQFVYYAGSDDVKSNGISYPDNSLQITDRYAYDQQKVDPRPKLVVIRGPIRRLPRYLGGALASSEPMKAISERQTTKELSMQIIAMSRQGDEAERLADITFEVINSFSERFRHELGWENIESLVIDPESAIDIDVNPDFVAVPISISGTILSTYTRRFDAPQFSGVKIDKIPKIITDNGKEIKFS